ncbi:hypothetical protein MIR68_001365 [Amoeboaphelidium protococcarum]|nr:hypothetical protein MIR68_001365 [Amoeboaphelidium protococcarum]
MLSSQVAQNQGPQVQTNQHQNKDIPQYVQQLEQLLVEKQNQIEQLQKEIVQLKLGQQQPVAGNNNSGVQSDQVIIPNRNQSLQSGDDVDNPQQKQKDFEGHISRVSQLTEQILGLLRQRNAGHPQPVPDDLCSRDKETKRELQLKQNTKDEDVQVEEQGDNQQCKSDGNEENQKEEADDEEIETETPQRNDSLKKEIQVDPPETIEAPAKDHNGDKSWKDEVLQLLDKW